MQNNGFQLQINEENHLLIVPGLDLKGAIQIGSITYLYYSYMEHFKRVGRKSLWTGANQNFTFFGSLTTNKTVPSTKREFNKEKKNNKEM